jgi:protein-disulfide isomerase
VHPHAQLAAEAAASQGKFWQMHDQLLGHQDALTPKHLIRYAGGLGLDTPTGSPPTCASTLDRPTSPPTWTPPT